MQRAMVNKDGKLSRVTRLTRLLAILAVGLVASACLVSTDDALIDDGEAARSQADAASEALLQRDIDIDDVPRASEAGTAEGPRRPDLASLEQPPAAPTSQPALQEQPAPAPPAATEPLPAEREPAPTSEPVPIGQPAESQPAGSQPALTAEPPTTQQPTAEPTPTTEPAPTAQPLALEETAAEPEPAATQEPAAAQEPAAVQEPAAAIVEAVPNQPVATDSLAITASTAAVQPEGIDGNEGISELGALACSIVELSLDELDRGDLATFASEMNTAAGFALTAPESGLRTLGHSLNTAASAAAPIDVITPFLTACVTHGYEL